MSIAPIYWPYITVLKLEEHIQFLKDVLSVPSLSLELRTPNLLQHDNVPVHKASTMKTLFAESRLDELESLEESPNVSAYPC